MEFNVSYERNLENGSRLVIKVSLKECDVVLKVFMANRSITRNLRNPAYSVD